ncbi:MAG TPA: hypothetical protein VM305_07930 [Candidatus Limnocylindrales bacterium]|nr:hypothetical protein [Candidatus Limnocylindrales bacterium]
MRRWHGSWSIAVGSALAVVLMITGAALALGGAGPSPDRQLTPANTQLEGEAAEDLAPREEEEHGRCVSAVAEGDAIGGKNQNHGGAVSEAARFTCRGLEPGERSGAGNGPPPWAGQGGRAPWAQDDDKPGNGPPPWAGEGGGRPGADD